MEWYKEDGILVKSAITAEERQRLVNEATILGGLAHPGVVELAGTRETEGALAILLRQVEGQPLAELGLQPAEVVAGLGAALATVVSDLHHLGIVHGAIEAGHVLVGHDGRPVLCSFGRARCGAWDDAAARAADVASIGQVLASKLETDAPVRLHRLLRRTAHGRARSDAAERLAERLLAAVPGARLPGRPGVPPEAGSGRRTRPWARRLRRRALASVAALGAALGGAAALVAFDRAPAPAERLVCPAVDLGCEPVAVPAGKLLLDGRLFELDAAGDVLVVGRWYCEQSLPALLDPRTGRLWAFNRLPTSDKPAAARLIDTVPGATGLEVVPGRAGCDLLAVTGSEGSELAVVRPRRASQRAGSRR